MQVVDVSPKEHMLAPLVRLVFRQHKEHGEDCRKDDPEGGAWDVRVGSDSVSCRDRHSTARLRFREHHRTNTCA